MTPIKKTGNRLLCRLLLALAVVVLGWNLYSWDASALTGDQMPMPFGFGATVVLSDSMEPTLSVNDLVVVQDTDTYAVGDIVVYQSGQELIVHRIVALDRNTVLTKGDATPVADTPCSPSAIKGRLTMTVPGVGLLVRLLRTPAGTLVVLAVAILLKERSSRREREQGSQHLETFRAELLSPKEEPHVP
jgi:signal peptidase